MDWVMDGIGMYEYSSTAQHRSSLLVQCDYSSTVTVLLCHCIGLSTDDVHSRAHSRAPSFAA